MNFPLEILAKTLIFVDKNKQMRKTIKWFNRCLELTLSIKRLRHRCFPLTFAKFFRRAL